MANKQCPVCKMEQPEENQHCVGCKATFDTTPKSATQPAPPTMEPETAENPDAVTSGGENGEENDDET